MKLKLDMSCHLLNAYTKFQIDISKHVEKKSGKLGRTDGRTDGQTDGHCHSIIRPFFKRAYKNYNGDSVPWDLKLKAVFVIPLTSLHIWHQYWIHCFGIHSRDPQWQFAMNPTHNQWPPLVRIKVNLLRNKFSEMEATVFFTSHIIQRLQNNVKTVLWSEYQIYWRPVNHFKMFTYS